MSIPHPTNGRFKDHTGKEFDRLTVLEYAGSKWGHATWLCVCECGTEKVVQATNLIGGNTRSCGCRQGKITHGKTRTPEHNSWTNMLERCYNSNTPGYHRYGGRGITVCKQWQHDFTQFFKYIGPRPSDKHSLDRIDNDGNYEPGNVRWATREEQANNRSNNRRK